MKLLNSNYNSTTSSNCAKPNHYELFQTDKKSRFPKGIEVPEAYIQKTAWKDLNMP